MKKLFLLGLLSVVTLGVTACGGGTGGGGTFTVGGTGSGLTGTGLVLQLNGANNLNVAADGSFTFSPSLSDGSTYLVTINMPPTGQTCSVTNGGGTISGANVTNVTISCSNYNVVEVTANIETPTTWAGTNIYVIKKYDFYVDAALTIQPGAIIKFHPAEGPMMTLGGAGAVIANGTIDQPIIFTSYRDDAHGGDTDGSAVAPAAADWGSVDTNGLNGSVFNYCKFMYGGSTDHVLVISYSSATVTNSTFSHNQGLVYAVLDAWHATAGTVIQNNSFYGNNGRPMNINDTFNIDDSNTFSTITDPERPGLAQSNTYNGIFLDQPAENFIAHIRWEETEVPFVMLCPSYISINNGATLTLGNNVVIKFGPPVNAATTCELRLEDGANALLNNEGGSAFTNRAATGVAFTSFRDDTLKGDTDGDGGAVAPAIGDWIGIYDDSGATPSPGFFTWENIFYDSYAQHTH